MTQVICQYCKQPAKRVTGEKIYPHRKDLRNKIFYLCSPCGAYVGCHLGTDNPLGILANAELRDLKKRAHAVFDPIWKKRLAEKQVADPKYNKGMARGGRYKKLAEVLGIEKRDCHIGMFSPELCKRTIEACLSGALND